MIIHRGPEVRTGWLVCIALFTIPFALRAHNVRNWVFLCVLWAVIGAALVWRYRQRRKGDKPPAPWVV